MKGLCCVILFFLFLGCADKTIEERQLPLLNGYWEIQKVEFPGGDSKAYKASNSLDFILLKGKKGFRKKVQPRINGTYMVSENDESFQLLKKEETYVFYYKNYLSEWQEQLVSLDSVSFTTKNEEGILYFYKRYEPISIQP
ncbi:MAG: hypothetical protein AAF575_08350 [Bacteroidota bacterium]